MIQNEITKARKHKQDGGLRRSTKSDACAF